MEQAKLLISQGSKKRQWSSQLSFSEIITILILFQQSHYRDFKTFYLVHVCQHLRNDFPLLVSYTRFVSLIPRTLIPFCAFLQTLQTTSEGISFIDSTPIVVCHNKRINRHLVVNHRGEVCACHITPGNVNNLEPVNQMTQHLIGKLFGDKGYISKPLFEALFSRGLQLLITGIRKNMKNHLMVLWDKLMLRKRSMIESINNQLKNVFQIQHTRHSSFNGLINILCALIAFIFHPSKPSIEMNPKEIKMIQQITLA